MTVLVICPSRGRPAAAAEVLANFGATATERGSRLVFVVDRDDPTAALYPPRVTHLVEPTGTMGGAIRQAGHNKALLGDATVVGFVGDDNRFRTRGWDAMIRAALDARPGVLYGDDLLQHERLPTAWWLSRPVVDAFGLAHPGLNHLYMDNYWKALAEAADCLTYRPDIVIEHLHPLAGKAPKDPIYARGNSPRNSTHDRAFFHRWQRRSMKADALRLRTVLRLGGRPRRVLADWHHPALWEALSLLFVDRFGWELYAPVGDAWLDHGWTFDQAGSTIGWAARDYLDMTGATMGAGGAFYIRPQPEYPERDRRMVTWEQAEALRPDVVIATLAQHQGAFAALARAWGAEFVIHVGNAVHPVSTATRPRLILASAGRLRHPKAVPWHQEFSRDLFSYSPPSNPRAVASFMLRMADTSCPWEWFAQAPGVRWTSVAAKNPHARGYLTPMSRVAAAMRATGWVWHDKRIGDGYGHVLHTAIAMGRPVIAHASHFRGQMGEPLLIDLETCIDLDRHTPATALRLWRAISGDRDWHREMSEATAARFDAEVDWAAEAETIRLRLE